MKKPLYVFFAALMLVGIAPSVNATEITSTVTYSRTDYRQGGYDVSHEIGLDPSDENKYNLYLMGESNRDYAMYIGDQNQVDYWSGWLDTLGPVVVVYP